MLFNRQAKVILGQNRPLYILVYITMWMTNDRLLCSLCIQMFLEYVGAQLWREPTCVTHLVTLLYDPSTPGGHDPDSSQGRDPVTLLQQRSCSRYKQLFDQEDNSFFSERIYNNCLIHKTLTVSPGDMFTFKIILSIEIMSFLAHLSTKCSVSFCDPSMSGVRRPSVRASVRPSTISLNNISSVTAYWILTKLHRNDPWVVP